MASSDSDKPQKSETSADEIDARRKRAGAFKASELLAAAQAPDASDDSNPPDIVSIPSQRKGAAKFKASDMLGVASQPASSDPPKTGKSVLDALRRRKRAGTFKASEMLRAAPAPSADEQELPHQLTSVDKRVYGPRELALGLVILAFAGVVAWILIGRQQQDAQRTVCAGNLRDMSLALFQYAQDNDECLPNRLTGWPDTVTAWNEQEGYTWRRAVAPYFKTQAAFRCPANPNNNRPAGCQVTACGPVRATDGFDVSYACNYSNGLGGRDDQTGNGYCGGKGASPVRLSGIASPSQMIAIVETVSPWSEFNVLKPAFADAIYTGHNGLSNYLFADGHVAPLAPVQTLRYWRGDGHALSLNEREAAGSVLGVR